MKTLVKFAGLAVFLGATVAAHAQEQSTNRVNAERDWSVFVEDNPTQCWVVSSPKETVNTKEGRVVAVNRGDILMFVSYWPNAGKMGEVSFTGGYPFGDGSTVTVEIGGTKFELFTSGENAWAASADDDNKIITAMKRGADAAVSGVSTRGTNTRDKFSLLGFTAALEDAEKRCAS
ncbi:MAG: invasion associated locus B family protein [Litoreibacter sp.]|nr:invasion associated locus B family protein [Litoreibacter sp.]